jgi:fatty-acyl-CoA synthase
MALTETTFNDLMVEALGRYPTREAFVDGDRRVTYGQSADYISKIMAILVDRGVRQGSAVVALSPNRPESWFVQAATYLLGARFSGLQAMGSAEDHVFVCGDVEASVLFADPMFAERAAEISSRCPGVRHVITFGPADLGEDLFALYDRTPGAALDPVDLDDEHIAWVQYTGGTTGRSKGVLLSHRALVAQTLSLSASWGLPECPRYLAAGPITHVSVVPLLPTLLRGGTVVLHRGFDPHEWLRTVQQEKINYAFAVPTMAYALLDAARPEDVDLSSLETINYGAAPMSPTRLLEAQERIGPVWQQIYGQTETTAMGTTLRKDEHDAVGAPWLLDSCGRQVTGVKVAILGDDCRPVAHGEVGEICIRSRAAMTGYLNLPEETDSVLRGGWVHTGDLGRRDDAGFIFIVDRIKDMIISGGFNIYAREVEDVLTSVAEVTSAAVIGIPDERWGEAVKAFVVARPGVTIDVPGLIALVKERKGSHQAPKTVEIIDSLPVTSVGKIDKKVLRAQYWPESGRAVH